MKFICSLVIVLLLIQAQTHAQSDSIALLALQKKIHAFEEKKQIDSVLLYENRSLAIAEKANYKQGIAHALSAIGIIYMHRGDFPKALERFYKALRIYEDLKNDEGILVQLGNIGIVYDNQDDFPKALEYYNKALQISESKDDKKHVAIQFGNIAIVYSRQHDYKKSEEYFKKALEIEKILQNKEGISRNLINLGSIYSDSGQNQKAVEFLLQGLAISEEIGDKNQVISCLANIGSAYGYLKQDRKAEEYLLKALAVADQLDDLDLRGQIELLASEVFSDMGKYKPSLEHYKKYIVLRDSVYNEENTKKSVKLEMTYQFDKKQAATKFENDKIIYQLEADNKIHKQLRLFLMLVIVLTIVLLIFAKRAYNNKKQMAEFMSAENERKEVLLQEVHHRINNNLQIISSLLSLQANSADDEKLYEYLKQSQNRIQSLSVLHELLYQTDAPLQINMKEYLDKVMEYHREILNTLPAKVEVSMNIADVNFPTKIAVPIALILNELVTNSIKYAFNDSAAGSLRVNLTQTGNSWLLHVSDSGSGIPADQPVRKDSLGLRLITIMTKQMGAELTKSNSPGATFELAFKITS